MPTEPMPRTREYSQPPSLWLCTHAAKAGEPVLLAYGAVRPVHVRTVTIKAIAHRDLAIGEPVFLERLP